MAKSHLQTTAPPLGRGTSLGDIRVVEIGPRAAGSILGMLMADQGATVHKVISRVISAPDGHAEIVWNRRKSVLVADDTRLEQLIRAADVVIDCSVPGSRRLDFAQARALRTDIVHCSFPARSDGTDWPVVDVDPLVGALTAVHRASETNEDVRYNPLYLSSTMAAVWSASAVVAALIERDRTGAAQELVISLEEAMLLAWGRHLVTMGRSLDAGVRLPLIAQYECADGRWVQLHGNYEAKWSRIILEATGHPELVAEAEQLVREGRPTDESNRLWRDRFASFMRLRPAEEWEEIINAAGGACAVCRPIEEWLALEHPPAAGLIAEVTNGSRSTIQPGLAVDLAAHSPGPAQPSSRRANPALGSASGEQGPLSGVKVLDLSILIAGPAGGRALAELGADVIKIDDPHRIPSEASWEDLTRGKRSILLDLKREEGRRIFWELAESADVVLTNQRPGRLEALGLGFDAVARRCPAIIYQSMNTYGYDGPWSDRAGWEQLIQASCGIQVRRGGRDGKPAVITPWVSDYGAGMLAAFAITLALRERRRTGSAYHGRTSLAQSATLMQLRYAFGAAGQRPPEIEGPGARGESAVCGLYEASDGWVLIDMRDWPSRPPLPELRAIFEDERFATDSSRVRNDDALRDAMAVAVRDYGASSLIALLGGHGVPAVRLATVREIGAALGLHESEAASPYARDNHPLREWVGFLMSRLGWDAAPARARRRAPTPGEHSVEIVRALGRADSAVGLLLADEVITDQIRPPRP